MKKTNVQLSSHRFGTTLGCTQLNELAAELRSLRQAPPQITRRPGRPRPGGRPRRGRREGDILGFVRGLRISAKVTYFLRERLSSHTEFDVNWGHLLDNNLAFCSPECDIVIHSKGHHQRWNGNEHPIMDFRFILASSAKIVVSCKSSLTSIDKAYPVILKRFGVKNVFLFAECCEAKRYNALKASAKKAGYAGLCCLYFTTTADPGFKVNEQLYEDFVSAILKSLGN
jgi:hypothetical protein